MLDEKYEIGQSFGVNTFKILNRVTNELLKCGSGSESQMYTSCEFFLNGTQNTLHLHVN